jgi:hypothetical protein
MSEGVEILALVVAVAVVAAAARRLGLNAPIALVVIGVLASFVPGVPEYRLDPEVVLLGLLPPLLYAAAIRTSLVDFHANRQAIGILAVGAVVFTVVAVGLVVWAAVPGVRRAAGVALGAVVAPPDASGAGASRTRTRWRRWPIPPCGSRRWWIPRPNEPARSPPGSARSLSLQATWIRSSIGSTVPSSPRPTTLTQTSPSAAWNAGLPC